MRARRRASATTAMRRPRRAARRSTHACNAARPWRWRHTTHAAWTSNARTGPGPAFVIAPFRCRVPELSSRGTRPRNAVAALASRKRSQLSSAARYVTAVIGPMPGDRQEPPHHRVGAGARVPRPPSPPQSPAPGWSAPRAAAPSPACSAAGQAPVHRGQRHHRLGRSRPRTWIPSAGAAPAVD